MFEFLIFDCHGPFFSAGFRPVSGRIPAGCRPDSGPDSGCIPAGFRLVSGRIPAGFRPDSGRFPAGFRPESGRTKSMISHYGNLQFYENPFWAHPFKLTALNTESYEHTDRVVFNLQTALLSVCLAFDVVP